MTDEFFDALKSGVAGVLKKYRPVDDELEEAKAEVVSLNLENAVYAQKLDDAAHEIARLNRVIRAMACASANAGYCPVGNDVCPQGDAVSCDQCIIDHFTRAQEAHDATPE